MDKIDTSSHPNSPHLRSYILYIYFFSLLLTHIASALSLKTEFLLYHALLLVLAKPFYVCYVWMWMLFSLQALSLLFRSGFFSPIHRAIQIARRHQQQYKRKSFVFDEAINNPNEVDLRGCCYLTTLFIIVCKRANSFPIPQFAFEDRRVDFCMAREEPQFMCHMVFRFSKMSQIFRLLLFIVMVRRCCHRIRTRTRTKDIPRQTSNGFYYCLLVFYKERSQFNKSCKHLVTRIYGK